MKTTQQARTNETRLKGVLLTMAQEFIGIEHKDLTTLEKNILAELVLEGLLEVDNGIVVKA